MNIKIAKEKFVIMLVAMLVFLPVHGVFCQVLDSETTEFITLRAEDKKEATIETKKEFTEVEKKKIERSKATTRANVSNNSGVAPKVDGIDDTTLIWLGVGAGTAAIVLGAVAISGGSSSSSSSGSGQVAVEPTAVAPPTASSLVHGWNANGRSAGSYKTYKGTFHLYDGGVLGYDLQFNDGLHLAGGGQWNISGYQLYVNTDHGSRYHGSFTPGTTYDIIVLSADNSWTVTLTR